MTFQNIKRDSLSKQVSDRLEKMIENGEFKIGEKIPTEPDLMEMFQVSRNTIREAIRALTWNGILVVRQGDGTYVRSSSRFNANMMKKYEQVSLNDIWEARNCFEVTIAHLAAMRRDDNDLEGIRDALKRRNELKEDAKENTLADIEFHKAVSKACHNHIIIDLYDSIADYLESQISQRNMQAEISDEEIDQLHIDLYEAIEQADPIKAANAAHNILNI